MAIFDYLRVPKTSIHPYPTLIAIPIPRSSSLVLHFSYLGYLGLNQGVEGAEALHVEHRQVRQGLPWRISQRSARNILVGMVKLVALLYNLPVCNQTWLGISP
jgi:hypothetical protein